MKPKMSKKVISGIAIGCLLLSLGGLVLAKDTKATSESRPQSAFQTCRPNHGGMEQHFNSSLAALVEKGTITQEQSDKIASFFREKRAEHRANREEMKNSLPGDRAAKAQEFRKHHQQLASDLAAAAGLSDTQAKEVLEALRPPQMHEKMGERITVKLSELVGQGTITQDQSDKLLAFFKEKHAQRQAEFEKMKGMTEDERKAYLDQKHHISHSDRLAELAAAGDLTDEQAKLVADALRPEHGPKQGPHCAPEEK